MVRADHDRVFVNSLVIGHSCGTISKLVGMRVTRIIYPSREYSSLENGLSFYSGSDYFCPLSTTKQSLLLLVFNDLK